MSEGQPLTRCDSRPIGEILREETGLPKAAIDRALEVQRQARQAGKNNPLCDVLVRLGDITDEEKARCLGKQWGLSYVDLDAAQIDPAAVQMLPEHLLREHRILPLRLRENRLTLAIVDPLDLRAVDEAHIVTGCDILPLITTEEALTEHLNQLVGGATAEHIIENASKPQWK